MTEQEQAIERAIQELARRIKRISAIADPDAFARTYWDDARNDGWHWREPPPDSIRSRLDADTARAASKRGAELARELLTRKDHP